MKLRPLLVVMPLVAGVTWLVVEARSARSRRTLEAGRIAAPAARPVVQLDLPSGPAPVPGEAVAETRAAPPLEEREPFVVSGSTGSARAITRGRLVDEATLEPIALALVVAGTAHAWTDAQGWFDAGTPLEEHAEVLVLNVSQPSSTLTVPRERWTRLAHAWQVPVAIGPTFRLHITGAGDPEAKNWEARLVRATVGESRWFALPRGRPPHPFLRLDTPVRDPKARAWIEVRSVDGLHEGRGDVAALIGIQEVEVACLERAVLRGRVVDEHGQPRSQIRVAAVQVSVERVERVETATGPDGRYQLGAAEPGKLRVVFATTGAAERGTLELDLPRGLLSAPDFVLAESESAGSIQGRLQNRSGKRAISARLRLRALDGTGHEEVCHVGGQESARDFELVDVPAGRFELSISSFKSAFRWSPATLVVRSPARGLVFTCEDDVDTCSYRFELVDADSGQVLEKTSCAVWHNGADPEDALYSGDAFELPEGMGFGWRATSPGYGIARGTHHAFAEREGALVARVALGKGYGARLALREWTGEGGGASLRRELASRGEPVRSVTIKLAKDGVPIATSDDDAQGLHALREWSDQYDALWRTSTVAPMPVAGATILADDVAVATSDAHGLVEFDLPAPPARIDVHIAGWRVVNPSALQPGKFHPLGEVTVWMIRE